MKKILAIAIASAFAAPAFAATANVDVYGTFSASVDVLDDDDSSAANVSSNASNIGIKGSEDLGGGLSAIFQMETLVQLDSSTTFGSQRDTFVGLKSNNWGTLRIGQFNTPMKEVSRKIDLFNNRIGDTRNLLRTNATNGVQSGAANAWEERFSNGIRYDTPSFMGLTGSVHYSTQFTNASTTNSGAPSTNDDRTAYSLGAQYKNGPLSLATAYQHNNRVGGVLGTNKQNDESAWRLAGSYTMGDLIVSALYHQAYDQAGVRGADRSVYGFGAGYKMGNIALKAQYYVADDVDKTSKTGADMFTIGADYNLSKRSTVYVAYAQTNNDRNTQFSVSGGGHGDNVGAGGVNGNDPSAISLGVIHKF